MSHTEHGAKGLHQQAVTDHKAAARHERVALAAYLLSQHHGFDVADPLLDWLAAEAEIDAMLKPHNDANIH